MGKNAGFWKKTGIALRKIFWDPFRTNVTKDKGLFRNIAQIGSNFAGVANDLIGAAEFAMDALDLDRKGVKGGKIETAMEAIGFGASLISGALNKIANGNFKRDQSMPFLDSIAGADFGETFEEGERFINEVRQEYEQRFGNGNSFNANTNQKPYGQEYDKAQMYPGSRYQLTRPGARKELFNLQRPHWTTSQSKINRFGQK